MYAVCEDLDMLEYRKSIDLYIKLETGEIHEWEIGGDESPWSGVRELYILFIYLLCDSMCLFT